MLTLEDEATAKSLIRAGGIYVHNKLTVPVAANDERTAGPGDVILWDIVENQYGETKRYRVLPRASPQSPHHWSAGSKSAVQQDRIAWGTVLIDAWNRI
jgi:hypothetical protein